MFSPEQLRRCSALASRCVAGEQLSEGELRELGELLIKEGIIDAARAWQTGTAILQEMIDRAIPCGHTIADLIHSPGHVTKCGACLAARKAS